MRIALPSFTHNGMRNHMTHTACHTADQTANTLASDLAAERLARLKLVAAASFVLLSWAGAYVAIGIAARELSPAPFALARIGGGALVLLALLPFVRGVSLKLPPLRDLPAIAAMALLAFPLYHVALNAGQRVVSPGVASVLIATLPIFAAIIARFTLGERPGARGWTGIAIAFGGVALLVTARNGHFELEPTALLVIVSAMSGSGYMVLQRQLTRRYTGLQLTIWGMWLGALMLTPFAPALVSEVAGVSNEALLALAYLCVLPTALAYLLWAYVLKMLPAARATSLLYIVPPIAFLLAWLVAGIRPGMMDIICSGIVIAGVALVQTARKH